MIFRRYKLIAFVVGAGIAGLAGVLFASWGSFIGPSVFGIAFAAQIIIWVLVGGLGTLGGAVLGTMLIQSLVSWLGRNPAAAIALGFGTIDTNLVLGLVLILFVLLIPQGLLPTMRRLVLERRQLSA